MKLPIIFIGLYLPFTFWMILSNEDQSLDNLIYEPGRTIKDSRDREEYRYKTYNGSIGFGVKNKQVWLTDNMRYNVENSSYYYTELTPANQKRYGRYYTWEAAQKACPPGWRLPTDIEWQRLIHQIVQGGLPNNGASKVYKELAGGEFYFGGMMNWIKGTGRIEDFDQKSFFWTATAASNNEVWAYEFDQRKGTVSRIKLNPANAIACRCIGPLIE